MPVIAEYRPPARAQQPRACCADCASPAERRAIRQRGAQLVLGTALRGRGRRATGGLAGIGGPRVDELTGQIKSTDQARKALELADKHLSAAWQMVPQIPLVAAAAGLRQAWRDRIENVRNYVTRTKGSLPTPITENRARASALALVQSLDILQQLDQDVNDPELQFLPNFRKALTSILGGGVSFVGGNLLGPTLEGLAPVLVPAAIILGGYVAWQVLR
jgi:hypothetical protein